MEESTDGFRPLATLSKHMALRLLTIGQNRLDLLSVELQEESEHLLHACLLAGGLAAFGMLATMALTAALVVSLWAWSHVATLLILTVLYGSAGIYLGRCLAAMLRNWQSLAASVDQLRKDRECLEKILR